MAIGKESMERAAKSAEKKGDTAKKTVSAKKTPAGETPEKTVQGAETITPSEQAMGRIVYQKSAEILERDAEPNESFGIGDAMPVYYL